MADPLRRHLVPYQTLFFKMDKTSSSNENTGSSSSTGQDGAGGAATMTMGDIVEKAGQETTVSPNYFFGRDKDVQLAEIFKRPVLISTLAWPFSSARGAILATIDPDNLWLTNRGVQLATSGYYSISYTLHLRTAVSVGGTAFGCVQQQLVQDGYPNDTGDWPLDPAAADSVNTCLQGEHTFCLDAACSNGCEDTLPWISPYSAHILGTTPGFQRVVFYVRSPLSNSVDVTTVAQGTIKVWAWASNVVLNTPIQRESGVVRKGGKTLASRGPVGTTAEAFRGAFGALKRVPMIGSFAATGEAVAGAVGGLADYFGFTRESAYSMAQPMQPRMFSSLTHQSGGDSSVVISGDPKSCVTIDPTVSGSSSADQMSYAYLSNVGWTVLGYYPWTTAQTPGTGLAAIPVTPVALRVETGKGYLSPLGLVGACHSQWHGSMRYRLKVFSSTNHRGRLQIIYSPNLVATPYTLDPTNISKNIIYDVEACEQLEFVVHWAQTVNLLTLKVRDVTTGMTTFAGEANGQFLIRVSSQLSAPDTGASVIVELAVTPDSNVQYFMPIEPTFTMESGEITYEEVLAGVDSDTTALPTLFFGSAEGSIRALVQRVTFYTTAYLGSKKTVTGSGIGVGWMTPVQQNFILIDEVVPNNSVFDYTHWRCGVGWLPSEVAATYTINPNPTGPGQSFLSVLQTMYYARRGGLRWKIVFSPIASANISAPGQWTNFTAGRRYLPATGAYAIESDYYTVCSTLAGGSTGGSELFSTVNREEFSLQLNNGVEFQVPFQNKRRYVSPRYFSNALSVTQPERFVTQCLVHGMIPNNMIATSVEFGGAMTGKIYVGGADDFTLTGFRRVPYITGF